MRDATAKLVYCTTSASDRRSGGAVCIGLAAWTGDSRFVPQWLTALPLQRGPDAKTKYWIQCLEDASQLPLGPHSI